MHSYLSPTKRLDRGIRLRPCFILCLILFNLFFLTNKVVQDLIKPIGLESRAEIKLIVIFFRSDSMTFSS